MKVLILDDHEIMREVLEKMVKEKACEVEKVPTFAEALEFAKLNQPDLMLVDLRLREQDEHTTTRRLPELIAASPHAAIVVISAVDGPEIFEAALRAGAAAAIRKDSSFTEAKLLDTIKSALQKVGSAEILRRVGEMINRDTP